MTSLDYLDIRPESFGIISTAYDLAIELPGQFIEEPIFNPENIGRPQQGLPDGRIKIFFQIRQQIQPDPVPQKIPFSIGTVFQEGNMVLAQIIKQLLLGYLQKGADDPPIIHLHHAGQTVAAGPPDQAQQDLPRLVIGGMGDGYPDRTELSGHPLKKFITEMAGCRLNGQALFLTIQADCYGLGPKIYLQLRGQFSNQFSLSSRLIRAQAVVHIDRAQPEHQVSGHGRQQMKQGHRVGTS